MDESLQYFERIDNYLNGKMSNEETSYFEREIEQDKELFKVIEFRRDLILGVGKYGDLDLEKTLTEIESKLNDEGFFLNEEHIRQYLHKELDPTLITFFEKRMTDDEAFNKEVEFQKTLLLGIEKFGKETDDFSISEIEKELAKEGFFESQQSPKKNNDKKSSDTKIISLFTRRSIAIAASILILISVSIYYLSRPDSYDQTFVSYFQPETTQLEIIIDDLESSGLGISDKQRREQLLEILYDYESENYKIAASALNNHLKNYPDDLDARFYYGISLLKIKNYPEAARNFEILLNSESSKWNRDVKWYLALSYLKINQEREKAIFLLKEIQNNHNSPYSARAEIILKEIDSN